MDTRAAVIIAVEMYNHMSIYSTGSCSGLDKHRFDHVYINMSFKKQHVKQMSHAMQLLQKTNTFATGL